MIMSEVPGDGSVVVPGEVWLTRRGLEPLVGVGEGLSEAAHSQVRGFGAASAVLVMGLQALGA